MIFYQVMYNDAIKIGGGFELERATQREREALERAANKALHKPNKGMPSEIAAQVFEYVNKLKFAAFTMGFRTACDSMIATLMTDDEADETEG